MIVISRSEKLRIQEKYPKAPIYRKNKTKKHNMYYLMVENPKLMLALNEIRGGAK